MEGDDKMRLIMKTLDITWSLKLTSAGIVTLGGIQRLRGDYRLRWIEDDVVNTFFAYFISAILTKSLQAGKGSVLTTI